jgi:hypothetical protein
MDVLGGAGQELAAMVHDPIFIGTLVAAMLAYVLAWIVPEPIFSKIAAALTTIALLSTGLFSISVIKNIAQAWIDLDSDADSALTDEQKDQAAKRFATRIGATGADCLVFIGSLLVGGKLPSPKGAPQAAEALAAAERSLAAPKPNGVVIEGPWGRAGIKPAVGEPPPRAMFDEQGNPLKIEFLPAPEPVPAPPVPEPTPAPAAGKASTPSAGAAKRPVIPVVPGTAQTSDDKSPDQNSMRHQIQRGDNDHFASQSVSADIQVGVTALQLRTTMKQNFDRFMSIARGEQPVPPEWTRGSVRWQPAITTGIARQSKQITQIVAAGGVTKGGDINSLRQCFNPNTLAPSDCASDDVRLDIENSRGHNLRS